MTKVKEAKEVKDDMVEIPREEYNRLMDKDTWLECLEQAGVDNWDGCELAHDIMFPEDAE
jgi:hypothetical protein